MPKMRILAGFNGWTQYNSIVDVDESNPDDMRIANDGVEAGWSEWVEAPPKKSSGRVKNDPPPPPDPTGDAPDEQTDPAEETETAAKPKAPPKRPKKD